ncbi:MAG TPA: zinc ribbon domain-containing protein [Dehalococcoidia bacterium]
MAILVPGMAWPIAVSWPGGSWQDTVKYIAAIVITYLVVLWVAGMVWVYRDIRDRTRDPFYHALAVFMVLVFTLPGFWLYLILRPKLTLAEAYERTLEEEALLQELEDQKGCPTCHRRVLDDYIVCPSCTTQLKEPCPNCGRPLSYSWVACPFCATLRRGRGRSEAVGTALVPAPHGANGAVAQGMPTESLEREGGRPAPAPMP